MRLIVGTFTALALAAAAPLAPAAAQAQGAITLGMQVTDAAGGPVGTVAALKGDNVMVKTDRHEALLPKSSFTISQGKLLFGMTRAQLNAEVEKTMAAASAAIVPGASVKGVSGTVLGLIDTVEGDSVTITLSSGQKIQVDKTALRGNSDGSVTTGFTADQLQALIDGKSAGGTAGQ
jgi:preprotein translocase subunit YajC